MQRRRSLTSFGSFDGCIDETLASSHGVKEELCRVETGQVRVLYEASRLRTVVVLDEMWQGSMSKPERYTLSFNILLSHTCYNLWTENI